MNIKKQSVVRRRAIPVRPAMSRTKDLYAPEVWFENECMYASCRWLHSKSYSDTTMRGRMTFENRLWRHLRDEYNILAQTLKLEYYTGRVLIKFDDDEEFIMAKIKNG